MCLCHRTRRWISKIEGCLDSAFSFCVRHFSMCEGAVPIFFAIFTLILTDSDHINPEAAMCWMAKWHPRSCVCHPWQAYHLSGLPRNEVVSSLCMLPIHHAAGTLTHRITLLFLWPGGIQKRWRCSALPVSLFNAEFRKPTEPAYIHWRRLPGRANLLPQAVDEHGG